MLVIIFSDQSLTYQQPPLISSRTNELSYIFSPKNNCVHFEISETNVPLVVSLKLHRHTRITAVRDYFICNKESGIPGCAPITGIYAAIPLTCCLVPGMGQLYIYLLGTIASFRLECKYNLGNTKLVVLGVIYF